MKKYKKPIISHLGTLEEKTQIVPFAALAAASVASAALVGTLAGLASRVDYAQTRRALPPVLRFTTIANSLS